MRQESTRDHADLLMSTKHWPTVFAVDMACDLVAHFEAREPHLASMLWEDKSGCFEKPVATNKPQVLQLTCVIYFYSIIILL